MPSDDLTGPHRFELPETLGDTRPRGAVAFVVREDLRADLGHASTVEARRAGRAVVFAAVTTDFDETIAALTLDEKAALAAGIDLWHTPGVERLGVPPIKVTDGPNGARGERWGGAPSMCFPCGTALGATWDPALVREVGECLGDE